jgi:ATP-dependent Clp protease protease subunit
MEEKTAMSKKFWSIKNLSESEGELVLYGEIADERPWWDSESSYIVPKEFDEAMKSLGTKNKITVRINSNGGDPFAATAIYTMLRQQSAAKEIIIEGVAASAATIIVCAGDTVKAPSNALFMIHNPAVLAYDYMTENDLTKMSNALKAIKASIIQAYLQKSNKSEEELSQLMDDETWMTGDEAKSAGFIDEILFENADITASADKKYIFANHVKLDIGAFKAIPNIKTLNQREDDHHMEIKNAADLQQQYPDFVTELINSAVNSAVAAERTRMKDIEEISANISPELVNEAKFTKPVNAAELALNALKNDKALASTYIEKAKNEAEKSGAEAVGAAEGEQTPASAQNAVKKKSAFARAAMKFDRCAVKNEEE